LRSASAKRLLQWYDANARDLPWRREPNAYRTLVSEVMLQQTQVATVLPYFSKFIDRFPSLEAVAAANEQEVLSLWQGLGYYKRARSLHQTCREAAANGLPQTSTSLQKLPGIGRYTARAVASIAFSEPVACVDGNVERVLARYYRLELSGSRLRTECERRSALTMPRQRPGDWNQALMELGASVCTPRSPKCEVCPLAAECGAFGSRQTCEFPRPKQKPHPQSRFHVCVVPLYDGRLGVRQITEGRWWRSLWEFPKTDLEPNEQIEDALLRLGAKRCEPLGIHNHSVTNHRVTLHAYLCRRRLPGLTWLSQEDLATLPMPAPQRVVLRMAAGALPQ
jgi:A/G-specific adenine glycosylase